MKKTKSNSGEVYVGLIVLIVLVAILMLLVPLISMAKRNDDTSEMYLQDELNDFVNRAAENGGFTKAELEQLESELAATNNSYDIEITINVANVNTKTKVTTYYEKLNTQVLQELEANGVVILQENDTIKVSAKNVNTTFYQMIRNLLYGITGNEAYVQAAQASAICTATGHFEA